jgi:hypothetical protein
VAGTSTPADSDFRALVATPPVSTGHASSAAAYSAQTNFVHSGIQGQYGAAASNAGGLLSASTPAPHQSTSNPAAEITSRQEQLNQQMRQLAEQQREMERQQQWLRNRQQEQHALQADLDASYRRHTDLPPAVSPISIRPKAASIGKGAGAAAGASDAVPVFSLSEAGGPQQQSTPTQSLPGSSMTQPSATAASTRQSTVSVAGTVPASTARQSVISSDTGYSNAMQGSVSSTRPRKYAAPSGGDAPLLDLLSQADVDNARIWVRLCSFVVCGGGCEA